MSAAAAAAAVAPRDNKGGPPPPQPSTTTSSSGAARSSTTASSSSSSSFSSRSEDLSKTWRSLANCLIMAAQKADKAAAATTDSAVVVPPVDRETDEYICNYLKVRLNWGRLLTYLEAELEGKAQEIQSLQHYYRSMPKCSRPRKRARVDQQDGETAVINVAPPSEAATTTTTTPPELPEVAEPAGGGGTILQRQVRNLT